MTLSSGSLNYFPFLITSLSFNPFFFKTPNMYDGLQPSSSAARAMASPRPEPSKCLQRKLRPGCRGLWGWSGEHGLFESDVGGWEDKDSNEVRHFGGRHCTRSSPCDGGNRVRRVEAVKKIFDK